MKKLLLKLKYVLSEDASRGFTLIELLVVIVIIGLLTTLGTVNYLDARARARDAQRKANLQQLQSALELYRSDQAAYPASLPACNSPLRNPGNTVTYIQRVPCDPSGTSYFNGGNYYYNLTGSLFTIGACIENAADSSTGVTTTSPGGSGTCSSGRWFVLNSP